MKLIVGLGNPGEKYENTRHNLGFLVIDHLFKELNTSKVDYVQSNKFKSEITTCTLPTKDGKKDKALLAKPETFMNNSGNAVKLLKDYYKIEPQDIWIIYDELDLPLGSIKIRFGGAAAGHHGVESIMEAVGTDKFWRFRLGIGTSHDRSHPVGRQQLRDAKEYVLDMFHTNEAGKVRELIKRGSGAIQMAFTKDIETAMNRYNTK